MSVKRTKREKRHTDDHGSELEALPHAFPMDLVWQIGKAHIAHQFFTNDGRGMGSWNQGRARTIGEPVLRMIASTGGVVGVGHLGEGGMRIRREREREEKEKITFRLGVREEVGRCCSCLALVATNLGRGSKSVWVRSQHHKATAEKWSSTQLIAFIIGITVSVYDADHPLVQRV
jgi:hypothetical protein